MSYPIINSVGWKFRELFDSPASALANGAEIRGGSFDSGSYTGGGNDAGLQYSRPDFTSFAETGFSMGLRFTPQDDPADSVIKRVFSYYGFDGFSVQVALQKSTSRIWAQVQVQPGVSGYLVCSPASTPILWGEENYLFITYDGTTLSYYFNGVFQVSDNATGNFALTPDATPNILKIEDLSQAYSDPVQEFIAYDRALSAEEVSDLYNGTTFQEVDDSRFLVTLPLRSSYNDGSNQVTENIGSLGGTIQLGDGTDPNTFPTQLYTKGFGLGNGEYLVGDIDELKITGDITFGLMVNVPQSVAGTTYLASCSGASESEADNNLYSMYVEAGAQNFKYAHEYGAGTNVILTFGATLEPGLQHIYMVRNTTDKTVALYLNGNLTETLGYGTNPTGGGAGAYYVSSFASITAYMVGQAYMPRVANTVLTETQMKWLYQKDMNLINQ